MKLRVRIVFGICSYGVALALLLFPLFSARDLAAAARIIPFTGGTFLLAGAALTNYELGFVRLMRFRDTAIFAAIGCVLVLFSLMFVSYGHQLGLIALLASGHGVIALLAYRTHAFARHDWA